MEVLPLNDDLAREFYITLAASERWGRNRLRKEIDKMLFERTAIATKPDEFIKKELSTLRDDIYGEFATFSKRHVKRQPVNKESCSNFFQEKNDTFKKILYLRRLKKFETLTCPGVLQGKKQHLHLN